MRHKMFLILSIMIIAMFVFMIITLLLSLVAPSLAETIGVYPLWWSWWLIDLVIYGISIAILISVGAGVSKFIEKRVPIGMDQLRASMLSTSTAILSATLLIIFLIVSILGYELALTLIGVSLLFSLMPSLISWLIAPVIINAVYGCRFDPELQDIVNGIATRANMRPPKAMLADMSIPNAFAYSSPIMGRYIAVTTGLIRTIGSKDELKAVIGHELGHHKHRDNSVIMLFGLIPTTIYFLGRSLMFMGYADRYVSSRERRSSEGGILFIAIGILLIAISIILQIAILSLSRLREYYADAHGAKVTSPYSMINALKSLDKFYRTTNARRVIANNKLKLLFIYALTESFIGLEELLSTHPPIYKRITFLESLIGKGIEA